MKLFQIEEPDGSPVDPDAPGVAIGIDISGAEAEVAVAVGGNAAVLADREGFPLDLAVPPPEAPADDWQNLFEGARLRAERALAQPCALEQILDRKSTRLNSSHSHSSYAVFCLKKNTSHLPTLIP